MFPRHDVGCFIEGLNHGTRLDALLLGHHLLAVDLLTPLRVPCRLRLAVQLVMKILRALDFGLLTPGWKAEPRRVRAP